MTYEEQRSLVIEKAQERYKENMFRYLPNVSEEEAQEEVESASFRLTIMAAFDTIRQLHAEDLEARRDHIADVSKFDTERFRNLG